MNKRLWRDGSEESSGNQHPVHFSLKKKKNPVHFRRFFKKLWKNVNAYSIFFFFFKFMSPELYVTQSKWNFRKIIVILLFPLLPNHFKISIHHEMKRISCSKPTHILVQSNSYSMIIQLALIFSTQSWSH